MKVSQLQADLRIQKLNAAVLLNFDEAPANFRYLAQYDGYGCLIIPQRKKPFLLVPKMEAERARLSPHKVIAVDKEMKKYLKRYLSGSRIGFDGSSLDTATYLSLKKALPGRQWRDISPAIEHLRMTKVPAEISSLVKACRISDDVYRAAFRKFRSFVTEQDVADFMETEARRHGCKVSFDTIVASGRNASMPHHKPTRAKLQKGFCVIDFGVKYKGYCTDTTRTVFLGKPTQQHIMLYGLVLKAQESSAAMCVPGAACKAVHEHAVRSLGSYGKYFIHGLGHGVGLQIHEKPSLGPTSPEHLQEHTAFTIEPGIYLPGKLGIRIEDTLLLRKKAIVLTNVTKKLLVF